LYGDDCDKAALLKLNPEIEERLTQ
jgi:hypothetical protein